MQNIKKEHEIALEIDAISTTNNNNSNKKKLLNKGLGKGLGALLIGIDNNNLNITDENNEKLKYINCDEIITNPYQPRKNFDVQNLQELCDSIKQQGIIQPIVVQKINDKYQIIAGERRWRAAKLANLESIPAIIKKTLNNGEQALIAIIENIQRDELNSIEEAQAFIRLQQEFDLTHEQIAEKVGKSRSHISNLLRLLNLALPIQNMLSDGKIDMGHARALLPLEPAQQLALANMAIENDWSVREIEKQVQNNQELYIPNKNNASPKAKINLNNDIFILEQELTQLLNLAIKIQVKSNQSGQIIINYNNLDDFENIISVLKNSNQ